jgi:hypothetical protein
VNLARLGRFMIGLGSVGIVRLIPEVIGALSAHLSFDALYFSIAGMDVVLAAATILAGVGFCRGRRWAAAVAMLVPGPVLATSIGLGLILFQDLRELSSRPRGAAKKKS